MDNENIQYLTDLATKAQYYYEIKNQAIAYVHDYKLSRHKQLCVSIILISAVWASKQIHAVLSEDDLNIFFGITAIGGNLLDNALILPDSHINMPLHAILDEAVDSFI